MLVIFSRKASQLVCTNHTVIWDSTWVISKLFLFKNFIDEFSHNSRSCRLPVVLKQKCLSWYSACLVGGVLGLEGGGRKCYTQNSVLGVQSDKTGLSDLRILCGSRRLILLPFAQSQASISLALLWHSSDVLLNWLIVPIWWNISRDGFLSHEQLSWVSKGLGEHQIQYMTGSGAQPAPFQCQKTLRSV